MSGLVLPYIYETRKQGSFFSKPTLDRKKEIGGEGKKEDQALQLRSQKGSVMSWALGKLRKVNYTVFI